MGQVAEYHIYWKVLTVNASQASFLTALLQIYLMLPETFFFFFYQHRTDTRFNMHWKSRPCPFPLNHPPSSHALPPLPLPPIFCLSHHQIKISVMKTSAGQLVRGLEMEIEKLKGSERSVCARITAHFITGGNRQIWHRIENKKTHYLTHY